MAHALTARSPEAWADEVRRRLAEAASIPEAESLVREDVVPSLVRARCLEEVAAAIFAASNAEIASSLPDAQGPDPQSDVGEAVHEREDASTLWTRRLASILRTWPERRASNEALAAGALLLLAEMPCHFHRPLPEYDGLHCVELAMTNGFAFRALVAAAARQETRAQLAHDFRSEEDAAHAVRIAKVRSKLQDSKATFTEVLLAQVSLISQMERQHDVYDVQGGDEALPSSRSSRERDPERPRTSDADEDSDDDANVDDDEDADNGGEDALANVGENDDDVEPLAREPDDSPRNGAPGDNQVKESTSGSNSDSDSDSDDDDTFGSSPMPRDANDSFLSGLDDVASPVVVDQITSNARGLAAPAPASANLAHRIGARLWRMRQALRGGFGSPIRRKTSLPEADHDEDEHKDHDDADDNGGRQETSKDGRQETRGDDSAANVSDHLETVGEPSDGERAPS